VFESIERLTKTEYGYATVTDVNKEEPPLKDEMARYVFTLTRKDVAQLRQHLHLASFLPKRRFQFVFGFAHN
jgi:hypothetical protein